MAESSLGKVRALICVSSSIDNFREKIIRKYGAWDEEWKWTDFDKMAAFFGLYHIGDYLRFLWHRGPKAVVWCGGDIVNLSKSIFPWYKLIQRELAIHWVENGTEQEALSKLGINSSIKQFFFDNPKKYEVCFKPNKKPNVFLCAHPESKQAYGIDVIEEIAHLVPEITFHIYGITKGFHELWMEKGIAHNRDYVNQPNIIYHGNVPSWQFDEEIRNYQCGLRLNAIDGFSEVTAKSSLMGQYPITMHIPYSCIEYAKDKNDLILLLKKLQYKKEPNYKAAHYWADMLA